MFLLLIKLFKNRNLKKENLINLNNKIKYDNKNNNKNYLKI